MRRGELHSAVVLAAGRGLRLRRADPAAPLTEEQRDIARSGIKALLPVAGRPFLDYLLDDLASAGIDRVCLVVGPRHDPLLRHVERRAGRPPALETAVQARPDGTADALRAAERFVRATAGPAGFLMVNSDNLYPIDGLRALRGIDGPGLLAFDRLALESDPRSNIDGGRIAAFAAVELDGGGFLRSIREKPSDGGLPRLVSLNCWRFSDRILAACDAIGRSERGELELPDAVRHAVERLGERFEAVVSRGPVLDLSSRRDVAAVAERLAARRRSV